MEIQKLKSEIITKIRSSSTLSNVAQCLTELVLNSLDAKSTSIAIRVNLITFRLQVVDNGEGITKENLELVGIRYMTNKCRSLSQLEKQVKYYGFRGETLACITDMSKSVEITSKYTLSSETFSKIIDNEVDGIVKLVKNRPSCGTTVTVEGFMYNLPIRKNRIVPELELEDIKKNIEYLVIIHPNVSFSIRNDITGNLILNSKKNKDIISSFKYLHPKIESEFSLMKVSKLKLTVEALLFKGLFENKSLQYVYVNKRPVYCPKIQKFVASLYYKKEKYKTKSLNNLIIDRKSKYPAYVINVKCPHSNVDILLNPSKTMVEFKNWNTVLRCLEKLIYSFFGTEKPIKNDKYLTAVKDVKSECGVSKVCGAYKAYGYKRRNLEQDDFIPEKIQRLSSESISSIIVEETQFTKGEKGNYNHKMENSADIILDKNASFCENRPFDKNLIRNEQQQDIVEDDKSKALFMDVSVDSTKDDKEVNKMIEKSKRGTLKVKGIQNDKAINYITNNDVYNSGFTSPAKLKPRKFKKPLAIIVGSNKNKNSKNLLKSETKKVHRHSNMTIYPYKNEIKKQINPQENFSNNNYGPFSLKKCQNLVDDEKTLFSKYTDDENKGKNLIMDMFLKSTQVFTEEDIVSDTKSEETIFEVESNFLMENNVQTNVNGLSKTMSVSVNIKSTKKVRKQRYKAKGKTSKCVQTSLDDDKMVSKCVQTNLDETGVKNSKILRRKDKNISSNTDKLAENYTIVFSDTVPSKKVQQFVFKEAPIFNFKVDHLNPKSECKCGCHRVAKKVFNFDKLKENVDCNNVNNDFLNKSTNLSMAHFELEDEFDRGNFEYDIRDTSRPFPIKNCYQQFQKPVSNTFSNFVKYDDRVDQFSREKPNNVLVTKEIKKYNYLRQENLFQNDKSPYFAAQNKYNDGLIELDPHVAEKQFPSDQINRAKQNSFYDCFAPRRQSTPFHYYNNNDMNNICSEKFNTLDDFTIDFGQFKSIYKTTQCNPDANIINFASLFNSRRNFNNPLTPQKDAKLLHIPNTFHISISPTDIDFKSHTDLMNVSEYIQENDGIITSPVIAQINDIPQVPSSLPHKILSTDQTNDVTQITDDSSKLVITLSDQQKQKMLEKELNTERDLNKQKFLNWDSQTINLEKERPCKLENEWIRRVNNFGKSFYINKRTGFATFCTPKPNLKQFKLEKRFEFMPKGLSPIMKDFKEVDKSLSQNKKELLHNYILESHQDDLLVIKWQNYIKSGDPKLFFELIYREKAKQFENCIPSIINLDNRKTHTGLNGIISFDKALFSNISVIGQVDRKFIAVLEKTKNLIILFDQHAVHERVRLEELMKAYTGAKIESEEYFILFIPQNDLSLLRKHELYLNYLGLTAEFFENGITVSEIPLCLYNKFKDNKFQDPENCLNKVIQFFINEVIELLKATRGVPLKNIPPMIQNIINLEACRGAIKFGDSLNTKDCAAILEKLSICKLPFQCAHGRPTLVPLITLDPEAKIVEPRLNFKKLKF